jgi:hypothetical protein
MVELRLSQSFELLGSFIESCIVNCLAARPRQGEVPQVYALQVP